MENTNEPQQPKPQAQPKAREQKVEKPSSKPKMVGSGRMSDGSVVL